MSSALLQSIYKRSPFFLQDLGVSLYGLKLFFREYGRKFERLLAEFEHHLNWTPAQLAEYQSERLRHLVEHCYHHVPYYREVMDDQKLTPRDFRGADDLAKLPVLTRRQVAENGDRLIAGNAGKADRIVGYTSGTTGSPLRLVWDRNVCVLKTVVDWRQKRLAGINPGDPIAFFLGRRVAPLEQTRPPYWRHNRVLNHLFCSSFHLASENLPAYFEKLARFEAKAVEGYPSTISILAGYLNSRGETFPLKAVFTSSEPLLVTQRKSIERAFACRVFDFYGMAERVVFATECREHEEKHFNTDFGLVEIADGTPGGGADGAMGRIIATGLHNFSMPLLRYETSDVTALDRQTCRCGCPFPRMSGVTSKDEDIVVTPDGRYISSSVLNAVTKHLINITESQIVQEDLHHVEMRVKRGPGYQESDTQFITNLLREVFGEQVTVSVVFVDSIPRTAAGKFRWVISKVPLGF